MCVAKLHGHGWVTPYQLSIRSSSMKSRRCGVDEVTECISSRPLIFIHMVVFSVADESPVLFQPLTKTTSCLSKHLVVVFTYWLVKLIDRFSMSPPGHKGFFSVPNHTVTLSLHLGQHMILSPDTFVLVNCA